MSVATFQRPNTSRENTRTMSAADVAETTKTGTTRSTPSVRLKRQAAARARAKTYVLRKVALFGACMATALVAGTMSGHVMLEKVRTEARTTRMLASEAKAEEYSARKRLDELTSTASIEEWAVAHGFVASDDPRAAEVGQEVVAQKD